VRRTCRALFPAGNARRQAPIRHHGRRGAGGRGQ
jgi:hypothetical protein